jgi:Mg2+-importing ATPase
VLLNNLLYDTSETGIPFDRVEPQEVAEPHAWDMASVLRFTLVMGPLSSLFDIAIFAILLLGFGADPATFRTAWFVESITTQILVIFIIRTVLPGWISRPHPFLIATSLGALAAAWVFTLTPLGRVIGFVPLSWPLIGLIVGLVVTYLIAAEIAKGFAMRGFAARSAHRGARL